MEPQMYLGLIRDTASKLRQFLNNRVLLNSPIHVAYVVSLRDSLAAISDGAAKMDPQLAQKLNSVKTQLFFATPTGQTYINPVVLGEAIFALEYLDSQTQYELNYLWFCFHPLILRASKKLYEDGHFANAAEDAFIEINERVKKLFAIIKPGDKVPDGDTAMTTVFSTNKPLIEFCDRSTETGYNKQKGYMEMLAGTMSALRNPKAHSNAETISADESYRRLATASMLMYAIDDAVKYSGIQE